MITDWNKQKDQSLSEGIAKNILENFLEYETVKDVSHLKMFQEQDIDLLAMTPYVKKSRVEVKNDERIFKTMNIFAEERRIYPTYSDEGWLNVTKADLLFYRDAINEYTFILRVEDLKDYIRKNKCKVVTVPDFKKGRKIKDVKGSLVNIYDFSKKHDLLIVTDDLQQLEFDYQ